MDNSKNMYVFAGKLIYDPVAEYKMLADIFIFFFRYNATR